MNRRGFLKGSALLAAFAVLPKGLQAKVQPKVQEVMLEVDLGEIATIVEMQREQIVELIRTVEAGCPEWMVRVMSDNARQYARVIEARPIYQRLIEAHYRAAGRQVRAGI